MVAEEEIVDHAAAAAADHIFSYYDRSDVVDLDVSVTFEDAQLTVDVLFETAASVETDEERERRIADDAALAATEAVDRLVAEHGLEPDD